MKPDKSHLDKRPANTSTKQPIPSPTTLGGGGLLDAKERCAGRGAKRKGVERNLENCVERKIHSTPFAFTTKADNLVRLRALVARHKGTKEALPFSVLPVCIISLKEFIALLEDMTHDGSVENSKILEKLASTLGSDSFINAVGSSSECASSKLIVRSSALSEDALNASNAGAYLSVANVLPEPLCILSAILAVFNSYLLENERGEILALCEKIKNDSTKSLEEAKRDLQIYKEILKLAKELPLSKNEIVFAQAMLDLDDFDATKDYSTKKGCARLDETHATKDYSTKSELANFAGVAFSNSQSDGASYRSIAYADDTSKVTSGAACSTHIYYKGHMPSGALGVVARALEALVEIAKVPIDIEFACIKGEVFIIQIRELKIASPLSQSPADKGGLAAKSSFGSTPLSALDANSAAKSSFDSTPLDAKIASTLAKIKRFIDAKNTKMPFLFGDRTIYGVMPDWNPAEIIGKKPRALAFSLYRDLITNHTWAYSRDNYGYLNLRSHPLILSFGGLPYVDVRVSFNSFIPKGLSDNLSNKLVNFYLNKLEANKGLHDKIEFKIAITSYDLSFERRARELMEAGFSKGECEELKSALKGLLCNIIHPKSGQFRADERKIARLKERRDALYASNADTLTRIYWLLEDLKRYGTLPFSGLARAGFIAVLALKSFIDEGILSEGDYDSFLNSFRLVSKDLSTDLVRLDRVSFMKKYGHLRPSSYDITKPRYDAMPAYFETQRSGGASSMGALGYKTSNCSNEGSALDASSLRDADSTGLENIDGDFRLSLSTLARIKSYLEDIDLPYDVLTFFDFLRDAISLRESSKFEFSKNLSDALELIALYGEGLGLTREDMSYCDISVFYTLYLSSEDPHELILASIARGKEEYETSLHLQLPALIARGAEIYSYDVFGSAPNFITTKKIAGEVVYLDKVGGSDDFLENGEIHSTARGTASRIADKSSRASLASSAGLGMGAYGAGLASAGALSSKNINGKIVAISSADPGYDWIFAHDILGLITEFGGMNSHMAIRASENALPAIIGLGEYFSKYANAKVLEIDCANNTISVVK